MLKTKNTRVYITVLVLFILLSIVLFLFVFFSNNNNYSFDTDTGFYKGEYIKYIDGELTVKNPNYMSSDIYQLKDNNKNTVKYNKLSNASKYCAEVSDSMVVYFDDGLNIYNTVSKVNTIITDDCDLWVLGNNLVFYTKDDNIFSYDISHETTYTIVEKMNGIISSLFVQNNYLYVFYEDNYHYGVMVYDAITNKQMADFKINNGISDYNDYKNSYIIPNGEQIIIRQGPLPDDTAWFYNFSGEKFTNENYNKIYSDIFSCLDSVEYSGEYMYYTLRNRNSNEVFDRTINSEENGLYKANLETGKIEKISDKCDFDDILATENYLYCYATDYLIPKGILKADISIGYTLIQIPLK